MSDQIGKGMARRIYDAQGNYDAPGLCSGWERFLWACKESGLIKPSKLDEAKSYVQKMKDFPRSFPNGVAEMGIRVAEKFEAAITEILEERE